MEKIIGLQEGNYVQGEELHLHNQGMHSNGIVEVSAYGIEAHNRVGLNWKPLDITPDILKRLGFDIKHHNPDHDSFSWYIGHDPKELQHKIYIWQHGSKFFFPVGERMIKIEYVHDLQNLYRLMNKEPLKFISWQTQENTNTENTKANL